MDTNTVTAAEDTDMADCDGEKVVTMMDVLREQEDFENDANAVLGASDEKNCTYTRGYIKRQAIYACMTCCAEAKDDPSKRAGVCLACSLSCHENHELIELYTKRNFRCDCGNPKFNSNPCQYSSTKTDLNENNEYNQNFSGLYCVCMRPYPDPETTTEDEMIQCIICEDWLHASHLEAVLPPNDHYSEMICKGCMDKNLFLHDYSNFAVNVDNDNIDVTCDNTINTYLNGDLKNDQANLCMDTSSTNAIEHAPDELSETNDINKDKPEKSDSTDPVKDNTDKNIAPSNANKGIAVEQELNSVNANNVLEEVTKRNQNTDAESMEEDKLLADPEEDGIEEPPKKKENNEEDDQNNKVTPDEHSSEPVPDDIPNTGNDTDMHNKTGIETDTSDTKIENIEMNRDIIGDTNPETVKQDTIDQENLTKTEHNQIDNIADETQVSELVQGKAHEKTIDQSNIIDCKQNDTNLEVSNIQPEEKDILQNIEDSSIINKHDNGDSKTEHETRIEDNSEALSNNDHSTMNKENNDTKTDIAESNVSQNIQDSSETNVMDNENGEQSTDIEMKNENEFKSDNGSEDKASEKKRKLSTDENVNKVEDSDNSGKRAKLDSNCIRPRNVKRVYKGATFWPSDFRQKLCTCTECLTMYKDLSVLFLTDFEDTVRAYENLGEEKERIEGKPASQYEKGLQALSSLDRIQQINALTEYNKMRDKLLEFLKSFKDRKEVVKEEDIKEFFAGMKPKREPDGVYFCR